MVQPRFVSIFTIFAFASAVLGAACAGGGFDACQESRTCANEPESPPPSTSTESGGAGGEGDEGAQGGEVSAAGASTIAGDAGDTGRVGAGGSGGTPAGEAGIGGSSEGGMAGGEAGAPPHNEPPSVVAVMPADLTTGVQRNAVITIEFSEPMAPETITEDSVQVFDAGHEVEGVVSYAGTTATFTPTAPLTLITPYAVSVNTSVTDLDGAPMAEEFGSSFTVRDGDWGPVSGTRLEGASATLGPMDPSIGVDGAGNALVVWHERNASGAIDKIAARWHRDGAWQAELELDSGTQQVLYPSVAVNEKGDAIAVWSQNLQELWARQYRNGAWEPQATQIATDFGNGTPPGVALSPGGEAHVVFGSWSGVVRARRTNASGSWQAATQIASSSPVNMAAPALSFDASGNGFVAWRGKDAQYVSISAASYAASTGIWSSSAIVEGSRVSAATMTLQPTALLLTPPALAVDASGGAMLSWARQNGTTTGEGFDLVASGFVAGAFAAPTVLSTKNALISERAPALIFDGHGYLAAWFQGGGIFRRGYANGAWGAAVNVDGVDVRDRQPQLGIDAHGNALLVWTKLLPSAASFAFDSARYTSASSTWSAPQRLTDSPLNSPLLVVAAQGPAALAWVDRTSSQFIDVRALLFE